MQRIIFNEEKSAKLSELNSNRLSKCGEFMDRTACES